jgi:hypothetical protein
MTLVLPLSRGCRCRPVGLVPAGLDRPDKGADDFPVDLRCELLQLGTLGRQKLLGVLDRVDPRDLDAGLDEAGSAQLVQVVAVRQGPRDATDPERHVVANRLRHFPAHEHIRHGEATPWLEDPERFGQHAVLVGRTD